MLSSPTCINERTEARTVGTNLVCLSLGPCTTSPATHVLSVHQPRLIQSHSLGEPKTCHGRRKSVAGGSKRDSQLSPVPKGQAEGPGARAGLQAFPSAPRKRGWAEGEAPKAGLAGASLRPSGVFHSPLLPPRPSLAPPPPNRRCPLHCKRVSSSSLSMNKGQDRHIQEQAWPCPCTLSPVTWLPWGPRS